MTASLEEIVSRQQVERERTVAEIGARMAGGQSLSRVLRDQAPSLLDRFTDRELDAVGVEGWAWSWGELDRLERELQEHTCNGDDCQRVPVIRDLSRYGPFRYSSVLCDKGFEAAKPPVIDNTLRGAGVESHLLAARLDAFRTDDAEHKAALSAARHFVSGDVGGLLLAGTPGSGKTFLSVAALRSVVEEKSRFGTVEGSIYVQTPDVVFVSVAGVLDARKRAFGVKDNGAAERAWQRALTAEYAVLDDVGVEMPSDWVCEQVGILIDSRYSRDLKTIVTTNLERHEIAGHLGERVASRLAEMLVVVPMHGPDRRRAPLTQR